MKIRIFRTEEQLADALARCVVQHLQEQPALVLGLPTGRTPLPLYRALVARHAKGESDYSKVTTFNLDEFVGIEPSHPGSYRSYMSEHLFRHVNVLAAPHALPRRPGDGSRGRMRAVRRSHPARRRHRPPDSRHRRKRPHRLQRAGGGAVAVVAPREADAGVAPRERRLLRRQADGRAEARRCRWACRRSCTPGRSC